MAIQLALPIIDFGETMRRLSVADAGQRGAVFTRREVVDFILDLVGYTIDRPLHQYRLLEPSFGGGDFLIPAVERLLKVFAQSAAAKADPSSTLREAICAVEIHRASFAETRAKLTNLLHRYGIYSASAERLLDEWLQVGDYLLVPLGKPFTHVVGNPPYVRQELIPEELLMEYKARYSTIYDRADLYVPFMERSLTHLKPNGALGFICSDRWMKNKYGGPLRKLVATGYHLAYHVDMVGTQAFHTDVIAYPAITVIRREPPGPTRTARRPAITASGLADLAKAMTAPVFIDDGRVRTVDAVFPGGQPWIFDSDARQALVRRLEASFPTLEQAGCRVGIGVATGADRAFIAPFDTLDVEPDRKLRLVGTRDIASGRLNWQGMGVVNPFHANGGLVNLDDYPKLRDYLKGWSGVLRQRNCAQKCPTNWYRTIDRIHVDLVKQEKLLIPDIKGEAQVVHESGGYYPHHNLYFIVSQEWDLRVLQAVLMAGIATLFVAAYSTEMRGGYLRFQAQYLRRIRVPRWGNISGGLRDALQTAIDDNDGDTCRDVVARLYGLTRQEQIALAELRGNPAPNQPASVASAAERQA